MHVHTISLAMEIIYVARGVLLSLSLFFLILFFLHFFSSPRSLSRDRNSVARWKASHSLSHSCALARVRDRRRFLSFLLSPSLPRKRVHAEGREGDFLSSTLFSSLPRSLSLILFPLFIFVSSSLSLSSSPTLLLSLHFSFPLSHSLLFPLSFSSSRTRARRRERGRFSLLQSFSLCLAHARDSLLTTENFPS